MELHTEVRQFIEQQPCVLHTDDHPDRGKAVCTFVEVRKFPPDWPLRIGDIVHNLRAALDNLVYELAAKHSGKAAAESSTDLQYPICNTPEGYHGTSKKRRGQKERIALLSPDAQAAIQGLQQYHGPDPSEWHPITFLREIANADKHRHIVLTHAVVGALDIYVRRSVTDVERFVSLYHGPIETGAVAAEFPLRPGETAREMNVDHLTGMDIAFTKERPAWGRPFRPFLIEVHDFILYVVFPQLEEILNRP